MIFHSYLGEPRQSAMRFGGSGYSLHHLRRRSRTSGALRVGFGGSAAIPLA
jgi:hypothetical protein